MNHFDTSYYAETMRRKLLARRLITPTGCWEYTRSRNSLGYGKIGYRNETWLVHRLSFKLFKPAEFVESLLVLHKNSCNNPACFNPEHLYMGTQENNMQDVLKIGKA